jgi:hypothetical protein
MTDKQTDKDNEELLSIRAMAQVMIAKIDKLTKGKAPVKKVSDMDIRIEKRRISFYKNLEKRRLKGEAVGKTNL